MACAADSNFGPTLGPGAACRNFDFTKTFEAAFFELAPSLFVLPLVAHRAWCIFRRAKVVVWILPFFVKSVSFRTALSFDGARATPGLTVE